MLRPLFPVTLLLAALGLVACGENSNAPHQDKPMADGIGIVIPPRPCAIDADWGSLGHYTLDDRSVTAMAADRQGRLLLAGSTATGSYVQRLTAGGALDPGFGDNGRLALTFGDAGHRDRPVGLALGPEDDLYLVVNHDQAHVLEQASAYTLLHVLADGSVDPAFAGGGVTADGEARTLQRTTYGQLAVPLVPAPRQWGLRQYSAAGELDTTLGSDGLFAGTTLLEGRSGPMPGDRIALLHDCLDGNCDGWRSRFTGNGAPETSPFVFDTRATVHYLSLPNPQDPEAALRTLSSEWRIIGSFDGGIPSQSLLDDHVALAYPDGWVSATAQDALHLRKFGMDTNPDISFCDGSGSSPARSETTRAGLRLALDAGGGLYTSSSAGSYQDPFLDYSLDADIFRTRGSAPDTTPADLVAAPAQHFDAGSGRYIMEAITINGLDSGGAAPARLLPTDTTPGRGWELSVDDGATWHNGWLWVSTGTRLMARRPSEGRGLLIVGGVLSPDSPGVPVGNVLTVVLSADGSAVQNPSGSTLTASSGGGSSGGSSGGGTLSPGSLLALLGLTLWRLGRRHRSGAQLCR